MIWEKGESDGFRNGFLLYDIIKEEIILSILILKRGFFKPYSSIYYLTQ